MRFKYSIYNPSIPYVIDAVNRNASLVSISNISPGEKFGYTYVEFEYFSGADLDAIHAVIQKAAKNGGEAKYVNVCKAYNGVVDIVASHESKKSEKIDSLMGFVSALFKYYLSASHTPPVHGIYSLLVEEETVPAALPLKEAFPHVTKWGLKFAKEEDAHWKVGAYVRIKVIDYAYEFNHPAELKGTRSKSIYLGNIGEITEIENDIVAVHFNPDAEDGAVEIIPKYCLELIHPGAEEVGK